MATGNSGLYQKIILDDINFICETVGSVGHVACYTANNQVEVAANPDNKHVAGILGIGVVNRAVPSNAVPLGEFTGTVTYPKNQNANETHVSGQVRLFKIGMLETDKIKTGDTPAAGDPLYVAENGELSTTPSGAALVLRERVATSLGAKNSEGFLKVFVNITGQTTAN